ncbi:MAG: DEAD/DEAH box helicase [Acidobacteriota bacterium]
MAPALRLTPEEELKFQQFQEIDFWRNQREAQDAGVLSGQLTDATEDKTAILPDLWELTRDLVLHDWQSSCLDAWFTANKRGVVKVVTGAGKTTLALAIIERLQQTTVSDLCVAIVVPTIVLLDQWRSEILKGSNLPPACIGFVGAGQSDSFEAGARIIIAVLNSASKKLAQDVQRSGISDRLLLIVDECHRAGAAEMRRVFETKRAYSLGLSATPERETDISEEAENGEDVNSSGVLPFESTVIGQELGNVVFELNYAEAIQQGILPPFRIIHYGLPLSELESKEYKRVSREITDLQGDLQTRNRRGLGLIRWCKSQASRGDRRAARYISLLGDRKRLLYKTESRSAAVVQILQQHLAQNPKANAILFHESIEEVMSLFAKLRELGFQVVAEHSGFPDSMRARSIHLFRDGIARVIVSARSLIEGFNVPAADIGIVVAASASVRQRIQTLGRLLRKNSLNDGSEKTAKLFVLYTRDTVDEFIYEKADWEHFIGAERNEYYRWDPLTGSAPIPTSEPPRRPPISEDEVMTLALAPGDEYPGDLSQGASFSLDTQGNIRDENGIPIQPNQELRQLLVLGHRRAGRFRVTPQKFLVFALEKDALGAWRGLYLGQLTSAPESSSGSDVGSSDEATSGGDPYPLAKVRGETFHVLQRDRRLVARKERGQIRFILPLERIADPQKRVATEQIQRALTDAHSKGHRINRITVTPDGDVVYVFQNQAYFLGKAPEGAEGFQLEQPTDVL